MNIHEYQAKELFNNYSILVPKGFIVKSQEDLIKHIEGLEENKVYVVKAQIHAGGRGKAGGVKVSKNKEEIKNYSEELLGKILITHQTVKEGKKVKTLLIEEGYDIFKEYYIALTLDRELSKIALIASKEGGTDIEEVAEKNPEEIFKEVIEPLVGLTEFQARRIGFNIKIPGDVINEFVNMLMNLYKLFIEKDCILAEINPLVLTRKDKLIALDAKMNFDENSLYRNQEIMEYRDFDEEEEKEVEASKYDLSYISLDGNIGCMVNGAGLAMATMDIIKFYGGEPANFLDVGGGASEEKVTNAFKIILSDKRIKGIFVNIFGGIMKCDIIAKGIVNAAKQVHLKVPLVVRLEGTNSQIGREILKKSDVSIETAENMDEGAKKIVKLIK